jgi:REP element-mobilizing transposase RayT
MFRSGYQIRDQQGIHFVTCTVIQWADIFSRPLFADIVVDSLKFCIQEKGLNVHAWVIMSNHIHLVVSAKEGFLLSDILRDFKKFTAGKIRKILNETKEESRKSWLLWLFKSAGKENTRNEEFQFWIQDNHPIELNNEERKKQKMNYLHMNPVRAGLVWEPYQYRYSSACDYMDNRKGLIDISLI